MLIILSIAQFFGLSLWFAPNAIFNQLAVIYDLSSGDLSLISISVIAGFIIGSLLSAFSNLPDLIKGSHLFFYSSLLGTITNALIIIASNFSGIWIFRFLTGISLAGIYPVGMKLTASHFKENRGLAIGILLSALTAGSGLPYLFNLLGEPDWTLIVIMVSTLSFIGGIIVLSFIEEGPYVRNSTKFDIRAIRKIYSKKSVRLANYGYFGHMWELYPFWVWIPIYLKESYSSTFVGASEIEITRFFSLGSALVFFIGALANILGGYYSDNIGRTKFNIIVLAIGTFSGLTIGFFFQSPYISLIIAIIWGLAIIPDSPQYSTMVTELAEQELVGTALTMQTAIGFVITMIAVQMIPIVKNVLGWERTFMVLSIGPVLAIISMFQLRKHEDMKLIANGKG